MRSVKLITLPSVPLMRGKLPWQGLKAQGMKEKEQEHVVIGEEEGFEG